MIIDTSAVVAILRRESERDSFLDAIQSAVRTRISAANYVESAIVVDGIRDAILSRRLDELLKEGPIHIEPVSENQARIAREAYRDFGKGSGHPARLNFGDCFAYALAKDKGEPLLFKGNDFGHTDVECWVPEED
jgi:ribonuclease VapC